MKRAVCGCKNYASDQHQSTDSVINFQGDRKIYFKILFAEDICRTAVIKEDKSPCNGQQTQSSRKGPHEKSILDLVLT